MSQRTIIIKNSGQEWRIFWIIATIILVVSLILNKSLYYVYLYFFLVAILLFFYSQFTYAELNQRSLKLHVGLLLKRSSIQIEWEIIDYIKIKYIQKEFKTPTKGITDGLGPTSMFNFEKFKIVEIRIKKSFSVGDQKKICRTNRMMLHERINIKDKGKIIQLKESPSVGFERLCEMADLYRTGRSDLLNHNYSAIIKNGVIIDFVLFLLPLMLIIAFKR